MPPVKRIFDKKELIPSKNFPSYRKFPQENFNCVQSAVFDVYDKDANIVIAAATGVGKTHCGEMIIANEVFERKGKALYLAPLKALAQEKIDDWTDESHDFSKLKLSICSGDYRLTDSRKKELDESNIILMTTEMLDCRAKNFESENNEFLKEIGTVVIDEFHLIGTPRGPNLETALMKLCLLNKNIRLVCLSATMPNAMEIAEWISYQLTGKETYLLESTYRPCPLGVHWDTYWNKGSYEEQEQEKINAAIEIIEKNPDDKYLIFVHTKKTGELMKKRLQASGYECEFHNADLDKDARVKLQNKFRTGKLQVVVATSTLAWGCFRHGTLIAMGDGTSCKVEELKVGDTLLNQNFNKTNVLKIEEKYVEKAIRVYTGAGIVVDVTEDHLFYSDEFDWTSISELNSRLDYDEEPYFIKGSFIAYNCEGKLKWTEILKKEIVEGGVFQEIEVDSPHSYFGGNLLSHNCNFPARRVIILGVHRGLQLVDTWDIWQEAGRAGRPGYDPRGDVYILCPESSAMEHQLRLKTPQPIESKLLENVGGHYKVLAFHLVSEIHHGYIKTKNDIHKWYEKSLAHFQTKDLHNDIVDSTIDLLIKCGAVKEEDGIYKVTKIGTISSMFYYSPFDVADLKRNFSSIFSNNLESNDYIVSMALGNVDSIRMGIVSKSDREEIGTYAGKIRAIFKDIEIKETAIKGGFIYNALMNGLNAGSMAGMIRNYQFDFPRLAMVLNALDSMASKWNKREFLNTLKLRIAYGVKSEYVNLCMLPDIGKIRAEKLYNNGIKNAKDVLMAGKEKISKILGIKDEKIDGIINEAALLS